MPGIVEKFMVGLNMIRNSLTLRGLFTIVLAIVALSVKAQPMLPDLAGITQKGINILTWNCQYDGVKSIAVQRSSDSAHNFHTVGYVKNVKKGVQLFADGHPAPGDNWYQLEIVFGSDLDWMSNKIKMHIDSATLENQNIVLPPNDSLQQFIVTNGKPANHGTKPTPKDKIVVTVDTSGYVTSNKSETKSKATAISKISISLSGVANDLNEPTYLKSEHVFTDPLTGHVTMKVPEVNRYHYSIKFYNQKNLPVIDIPRISESPIILDKRNFEQKGLYKFILRRENREFETGYITIF